MGQSTEAGARSAHPASARGRSLPRRYVSAQAYYHALRAAFSEAQGDLPHAADELQLALVYDQDSLQLTLDLARISLALDRLGKAKKMVDRAQQLGPEVPGVALLAAQVAQAEGRWDRAERILRRADRRSEGQLEVALRLARLLGTRDRIKEASAVLRRAADRWPQSTEPLLELAELERARGALGGAAEALERAHRRDPEGLRVLEDLTEVYERQGRLPRALKLWRAHLQWHPGQRRAQELAAQCALLLYGTAPDLTSALIQQTRSAAEAAGLAQVFVAVGAFELALPLLQSAQSGPGVNAQVLLHLGQSQEAVGHDKQALAALERIGPEAGSVYVEARARLAELHLWAGRGRRAEQALQVALQNGVKDARVVVLMAQAQLQGRDPQQALRTLEPSEGVDPTALVLARAQLLQVTQGAEAARQVLEAQLGSDPGPSWPLQWALGRLALSQGDRTEAEGWLRQAVGHSSAPAELWADLGRARAGQHPAEALVAAQTALALAPRAPKVLDALGRVFEANGDLEHARTFLGRAARLSPRDPDIMEHMADIEWELGHHAAAKTTWRSARARWRPRGQVRDPGASEALVRLAAKLKRRSS